MLWKMMSRDASSETTWNWAVTLRRSLPGSTLQRSVAVSMLSSTPVPLTSLIWLSMTYPRHTLPSRQPCNNYRIPLTLANVSSKGKPASIRWPISRSSSTRLSLLSGAKCTISNSMSSQDLRRSKRPRPCTGKWPLICNCLVNKSCLFFWEKGVQWLKMMSNYWNNMEYADRK